MIIPDLEQHTRQPNPLQVAYSMGFRMANPATTPLDLAEHLEGIGGDEAVLALIDGFTQGREHAESLTFLLRWRRRNPHLTAMLTHLSEFGESTLVEAAGNSPSTYSALIDGTKRGLLITRAKRDETLLSLSTDGERLVATFPSPALTAEDSGVPIQEFVDTLIVTAIDHRRAGRSELAVNTFDRAQIVITTTGFDQLRRPAARLASAMSVAKRTTNISLEFPENWFESDDSYVDALEHYRAARSLMVSGSRDAHCEAREQLQKAASLLDLEIADDNSTDRLDALSRKGWVHYALSISHRKHGAYDEALYHSHSAEDAFSLADDSYGQACSLSLAGFIYRLGYDTDSATQHLEAAIEISEANGFDETAGDAHLQMAATHTLSAEALSTNFTEAERSLDAATNSYSISGKRCAGSDYIGGSLGVLAMREGDLRRAIRLTRRSYDSLSASGRREGQALMARRLAILTWRKGFPRVGLKLAEYAAEVYSDLSPMGRAESLLTKALCCASLSMDQEKREAADEGLSLLGLLLTQTTGDDLAHQALIRSWHWRFFTTPELRYLSDSYSSLIRRERSRTGIPTYTQGSWQMGPALSLLDLGPAPRVPTDQDSRAAALLGQEPIAA